MFQVKKSQGPLVHSILLTSEFVFADFVYIMKNVSCCHEKLKTYQITKIKNLSNYKNLSWKVKNLSNYKNVL